MGWGVGEPWNGLNGCLRAGGRAPGEVEAEETLKTELSETQSVWQVVVQSWGCAPESRSQHQHQTQHRP